MLIDGHYYIFKCPFLFEPVEFHINHVVHTLMYVFITRLYDLWKADIEMKSLQLIAVGSIPTAVPGCNSRRR